LFSQRITRSIVPPWAPQTKQRKVVVVVEGAERLVPHDREPEPLGDPLYREVAELLKFVLFHDS
jgi:hypothetical protein